MVAACIAYRYLSTRPLSQREDSGNRLQERIHRWRTPRKEVKRKEIERRGLFRNLTTAYNGIICLCKKRYFAYVNRILPTVYFHLSQSMKRSLLDKNSKMRLQKEEEEEVLSLLDKTCCTGRFLTLEIFNVAPTEFEFATRRVGNWKFQLVVRSRA